MSGSKLAFLVLFVVGIAVASTPTPAQSSQTQSQTAQASPAAPATPPAAKPADVTSPDAILGATYDVISGPPGKRDWDRFRSLFVPGARLIAVQRGKTEISALACSHPRITSIWAVPILKRTASSRKKQPGTPTAMATSCKSSALTNLDMTRKTRRPSRVGLTAFNCFSTAHAGGWSQFIGRKKLAIRRCRRNFCLQTS